MEMAVSCPYFQMVLVSHNNKTLQLGRKSRGSIISSSISWCRSGMPCPHVQPQEGKWSSRSLRELIRLCGTWQCGGSSLVTGLVSPTSGVMEGKHIVAI